MKQLNFITLLLITLFVGACGMGKNTKGEDNEGNKTVLESIKEGDYLQRIIDESKEHAQMLKLIYNNIEVKEGRIELTISKKEFENSGFNAKDYERVEKIVAEYNKAIDSEAVKEAKALVKDFIKYVADKLEELVE